MITKSLSKILFSILILCALLAGMVVMSPPQPAQAFSVVPIYVKADAIGANNGSSWTDAYTSLQSALDAANSGQQIWVAAGTYKPTYQTYSGDPPDPLSATFMMRDGVAIYGGFDGNETLLSQRKWQTLTTTLSGDLYDTGDFSNQDAYNVVTAPSGITNTAILDGFTIIAGNATENNGTPDGGGMYCDGSPTLQHLTFYANSDSGYGGGGMYNDGSPVLNDVAFINNTATNGAWGGGMLIAAGNPVLNNCLFVGNTVQPGAAGGGIDLEGGTLTLTNCTFSQNTAYAGGAIVYLGGTLHVTNCILWANVGDHPDIYNARASASPDITINYSDFDPSLDLGISAGTGCINADPLFVSSSDFHLKSTSPAIDKGQNAAATTSTDLDGNPRIVNSTVDMGPYEYQGVNPTKLAFTTQPSNANQGVAINPAVKVSIEDTDNNVITSDNSTQVTVAMGTNPSSGTLSGTKTITASNGVATFSDLSIDKAGTGYTLTAISSTLTGDTSIPFNINPIATAPTVTSISPNKGTTANNALPVTITGTGFINDSGLAVELNNGGATPIAGTSVTWKSATQITCIFNLSGVITNLGGAWDVKVTNPDAQTGTGNDLFTIFRPDPTVTSVTSQGGANTGPVSVQVYGTNFVDGQTSVKLTKPGQSDINGTGVDVYNSGFITCTFDLTGVVGGAWDVMVTVNGAEHTGTLDVGFGVFNPGPIIYVNSKASGPTHDGNSWASAYTDLQDALTSAEQAGYFVTQVDQIWVAAGTYEPTSETDRTATFSLPYGVTIYGGFPATGTPVLADRDWVKNVTILSGDIGVTGNDSDNSYSVVFAGSFNSVLDGFTITGGNSNGGSDQGGGINCITSPTLRHLVIQSNSALRYGGGMYDWGGANLQDVTFSGNTVNNTVGTVYTYGGGGLYEMGTATLNNVSFSGNSVSGQTNSLATGGGMYSRSASTMNNVVFDNNSSSNGGGLYLELSSETSMKDITFSNNHSNDFGGGGMYVTGTGSATIDCIKFLNNTAKSYGGGIYIDTNSANAVLNITNAIFTSNIAGTTTRLGQGGGIDEESGTIHLKNATFSGNQATGAAGAIFNYNSLDMVNCIFWNNTAGLSIAQGGYPDIVNWGTANISYSDYNPDLSDGIGSTLTTGSINSNPKFKNAAGDDFHLSSGSPAIDSGNNSAVPVSVTTDLDGNPRIVSSSVDMGPYEYQVSEDTTPPDTSILTYPPSLTNSTSANFTWTGSDNVTSTVNLVYSYQLDSASWGNWSSSTSTSYSALSAGSHTFNVKAKDEAGNEDNSPASCTWTIDTTPPTLPSVTIASSNTNPSVAKSGDMVTLTFTSDEDIQTPTVTITGHTVNPNGSGSNWSAAYTMTGTDIEGTVSFNIDFSDLAGNAGIEVTSVNSGSNVTFDRTAPSSPGGLNITPSSPSKDARPTFSWTKATDSGTGVNHYQYGIASTVVYYDIGNVTSFTPSNDILDGDHTFYIRPVDAAGNIGPSASLAFVIDTESPTVTLSSTASPGPTNLSPIPMTATFSEGVTGFVIGDITVGNGTASHFSSSGTLYTFDITPIANGIVTVDIGAGVAQDVATNPNTAATQFSITYNTTGPTVTLTSGAPDPTNAALSVTATFSGSVTGFAVGDISVTNGTAGSFTGSGASYSFTVTPTGQGLVSVNIPADVAQDVATNGNAVSNTLTRTYDNLAPTVTLSSTASPGPTNLSPILLTATFSEGVTGFVIGDITVGNGTASNFSGSGALYTFDITPIANGIVTVDIGAGVAQDTATNPNTAATQFSITYTSSTNVQVTVGVSPSNLRCTVDGYSYTGSHTYTWKVGSQHWISVTSPQSGISGTRWVWSSWSDGRNQSHLYTVTSASTQTITATFTPQYRLTLAVNPSGSGSITGAVSGNYYSGSITLTAVPSSNAWVFSNWSGDATGSSSSLTITNMSKPMSITANFSRTTSKINTTTTIRSSNGDTICGQPVTFTATVTSSSPSSAALDGTMQFVIDGAITGTGSLSGGIATFTPTASQLRVGYHQVKSVYLGNSSYNGSTSRSITQEVSRARTSTKVTAPRTTVRNTKVTITGTVTAQLPSVAIPSGTVTFKDGYTVLAANVTLDNKGVASCSASFSKVGTHTITAVFNDGSNFQSSTGTATVTVTSS
jgi:hypothetical protein